VKLRGGVISGILLDSTPTGGLLLENVEILEDKRGRLSISRGFEYFKDKVFIRGDNIIAIMLKPGEESDIVHQE